jgi:hypothetical protein
MENQIANEAFRDLVSRCEFCLYCVPETEMKLMEIPWEMFWRHLEII